MRILLVCEKSLLQKAKLEKKILFLAKKKIESEVFSQILWLRSLCYCVKKKDQILDIYNKILVKFLWWEKILFLDKKKDQISDILIDLVKFL